MEWKWTKGDGCERSKRPKNNEQKIMMENQIFSIEQEESAYSSALNHDENTWDMMNQNLYNSGFKQSNKREDLDFKIADRALMQQRGANPFLSQSNYADDINASNIYLQPINTTQDREKFNNDK